jgi:hypothetical protein
MCQRIGHGPPQLPHFALRVVDMKWLDHPHIDPLLDAPPKCIWCESTFADISATLVLPGKEPQLPPIFNRI